MKTKWVRITERGNIPLREGRSVRVGNRDIAIFNLGDRFLAVDNRCPHKGGPLSEGIVSGSTVVCPLHAWKVDLECGAVKRPADIQACVKIFSTRVKDGVVQVEVPVAAVKEMKCDLPREAGVNSAALEQRTGGFLVSTAVSEETM